MIWNLAGGAGPPHGPSETSAPRSDLRPQNVLWPKHANFAVSREAAECSACPSGWKASPSPADGASEPRCFLVPPERSTSLRGCVERCARHGGAPACLASQEETDFVTGEVCRRACPALSRS